ncbi:MAG: class I SAM-dependent methyltransferase [Methanomassiliicoccaceae archaeon]|nr:class I SAM-dependent methyltransferase [Methanomassiliicoccaceae archaeon]
MSGFKEYWARQFGRPEGFGGRIAAFLMNRMNREMYAAVEEHVPKGGTCLEIGFGNGVLLKHLLKSSEAVFYGVEISSGMMTAAAKRNNKAISEGRLTLSEGSADAIPFEQEFDIVYTVNTIYFWPDLNAGLKEIFSNLRPGGIFLNVAYTKEWLDRSSYTEYGFRKYTPAELIAAAEENGFSAEEIKIRDGRSYAVKAIKR